MKIRYFSAVKVALVAWVALCSWWVLKTPVVWAANFVVDNTNDTADPGTLRTAIADANNASGADTITFNLGAGSHTITLASDLPFITETLTISGPGMEALRVDGQDQHRIFDIGAGAPVTITDMTLVRGVALVTSGGAVRSASDLYVARVKLHDNEADVNGGAIVVFDSDLAIESSQVYSNNVVGNGGGIAVSGSPSLSLSISDTEIYSNHAKGGSGGGVSLDSTNPVTATVIGSALYNNQAAGGGGGFSINSSTTSTLVMDQSQVYSNTGGLSTGGGGAVRSDGDVLALLTDTQIYSNQVSNSGGGLLIHSNNQTARLVTSGSRIWANRAADGGGVHITSSNHVDVEMVDSEVYSNTGSSGGGMFVDGTLATTVALSQTALYSNTAAAGTGGGARITSNGDVTATLLASPVYANRSTQVGGGLNVQSDGVARLTSNSPLWGNHSDQVGGGLYFRSGGAGGVAEVQGSDVYSNEASSGAGVYIPTGLLLVEDSTFYENHAAVRGGGVYVESTAYFTRTNFLNNRANSNGGALFQDALGTIAATDGCIVGNSDLAMVNGDDTPVLVATNNWWGWVNGPSGAGPGYGDSVGSDVDFSNFKTVAPAGCPSLMPELALGKQVEGLPAPGESVTYTLTLTNSNGDEPGALLVDHLPAAVDFAGWLEQPAGAIVAGDVITWSGPITANEQIQLRFVTTFTGDYGDVVTNTANFTGTLENGEAQATFTAQELLTVARDGSGSGSVSSTPGGITCGVDCEQSYAPGTVVTLTATGAVSSTWDHWSGACTGSGDCVVTMDAAKAVTATFSIKSLALGVTKTGDGNGTVVSLPAGISCSDDCDESYLYGTVVTLTANAGDETQFMGWGGACSGTDDCVVTMDDAKNVTATFTLNRYTLSVTKAGDGSGQVVSAPAGIICGADCGESYAFGTPVTLTATAGEGSLFSGWGGACSGSGACVVTLDAAKTVSATFTLAETQELLRLPAIHR